MLSEIRLGKTIEVMSPTKTPPPAISFRLGELGLEGSTACSTTVDEALPAAPQALSDLQRSGDFMVSVRRATLAGPRCDTPYEIHRPAGRSASPTVVLAHDAEELDDVSEFLGKADVERGHHLDATNVGQ